MNITLKDMAARLSCKKECIIYYHKKPDGDAIGCAYALLLALRSRGCRAAAVCPDSVPDKYRSLVSGIPNDEVEHPAIVAVDCSAPYRLGRYAETTIDFCIDHHEQNTIDARFKYIDGGASSCCEIVFALLKQMDVKITPRIAGLLYFGLMTDTDSFRSINTTPASFAAAAELTALGADHLAAAALYSAKSPARMEMEQRLCASFHYTCGRRVLGSMLTYQDYSEVGIKDSELDGLNALVEHVDGVVLGIVVRELKPGSCRISVRAAAGYDADAVCRRMGGGGHVNAAGAELSGTPAEVLARAEDQCRLYLERV